MELEFVSTFASESDDIDTKKLKRNTDEPSSVQRDDSNVSESIKVGFLLQYQYWQPAKQLNAITAVTIITTITITKEITDDT